MPAANTQLTLRINVALSPAAARRLDGLAAAAETSRRAVIEDALALLADLGENYFSGDLRTDLATMIARKYQNVEV